MINLDNPAESQCLSERNFEGKTARNVFLLQFIWRWICAGLFATMIICSLLEIGRSDIKSDYHLLKWFIYLTNWVLLIGLIQSLIAVGIVTKAFKDKNHFNDTIKILTNDKSNWGRMHQIGYSIALVFALFTTLGYWVVVYDPNIRKVDFIILIGHAFPLLLMAIDAIIFGHPIKMKDVYINVIFIFPYTIFSLIYFLAGGVNRRLSYKIYSLLDWKKPLKTCILVASVVVVIVVFHSIFYGIYRLRTYLSSKLCKSKNITSIRATDVENLK